MQHLNFYKIPKPFPPDDKTGNIKDKNMVLSNQAKFFDDVASELIEISESNYMRHPLAFLVGSFLMIFVTP